MYRSNEIGASSPLELIANCPWNGRCEILRIIRNGVTRGTGNLVALLCAVWHTRRTSRL